MILECQAATDEFEVKHQFGEKVMVGWGVLGWICLMLEYLGFSCLNFDKDFFNVFNV